MFISHAPTGTKSKWITVKVKIVTLIIFSSFFLFLSCLPLLVGSLFLDIYSHIGEKNCQLLVMSFTNNVQTKINKTQKFNCALSVKAQTVDNAQLLLIRIKIICRPLFPPHTMVTSSYKYMHVHRNVLIFGKETAVPLFND